MQDILNQFLSLTEQMPLSIQREAGMVVHKMTHPMRDILAKVPGDSLTDKAKKLKVSRQTFYVWLNERFRPTLRQAKRISKYTDVPVSHIVDNGFEGTPNVTRRKAPKKTAHLATRRTKTTKRDAGDAPRRQRKVDAGNRAKPA